LSVKDFEAGFLTAGFLTPSGLFFLIISWIGGQPL
jgi:hypothetical protein